MTDLTILPESRRKWPGYRGSDAILLLQIVCLNCGDLEYKVEACYLSQLEQFQEYLEIADVCRHCNCEGTRCVGRIYEGRSPSTALFSAPFFVITE